MISISGRSVVSDFIEPIARALNKIGITPNAVTICGTVAACTAAIFLIPTGHLVAAAITIGLVSATDMIDGTMARLRGGGTKYGATLDASCDRIVDGALFGSIAWWLAFTADPSSAPLTAVTLVILVASQVISYVKARAEASGIKVDGGLVERPERLIVALVTLALCGWGVPYALGGGLILLAVGSVFTVFQRLWMVSRSDVAQENIAAPTGAKEFLQEDSE